MPPPVIVDPATIDLTTVRFDIEAIRQVNPQRFEMEMLDAVVHLDLEHSLIIGYKDVRADEFWARGHMPGYPLMPGVLQCEAAAQLATFYLTKKNLVAGDYLALGGLENVRFRSVVRPGDRLVLVGKALRETKRQSTINVQGFVGSSMAFHVDLMGMPITRGAS